MTLLEVIVAPDNVDHTRISLCDLIFCMVPKIMSILKSYLLSGPCRYCWVVFYYQYCVQAMGYDPMAKVLLQVHSRLAQNAPQMHLRPSQQPANATLALGTQ